jgi:CubicO group peptidase (beta-lactamase class C family)
VKRIGLSQAIAGLLTLGTARAWCGEPAALPDTPAGQQMRRLLEALGTGQPDRIRAFIEANFAAGFLKDIPLDRHVDVNTQVARETGGLVPRQVTSSYTGLRLLAESKKEGASYQVSVEVEATQPHKITGLLFRHPPPGALVPRPPIPEGPFGPQQLAAWMRDYLERLSRADAFSGAVLVARHDRVIFAGAYGLASRAWNQPNRLDTKFNLGSMNKMFTSIAVAQLVEKGKLSLGDPIGKHLRHYPNRDAAAKVTVRHLLSHTSGLADIFNAKFLDASRTRFRAIQDYFPLFADEPLQFEPGTRFGYSNAGFTVLGAIVQEASGMDYFDYVREHIYRPAGMTDTDAYELDTDVPNLAVGYTRGEGGGPGRPALRNNTFLHVIKGGPAGGGYSTVEDLRRFAEALRKGALIRPETLRQWTTPGDTNPGYALGFQVFHADRPRVVGHTGGFPGISAVLRMDLDNGYTAAVLANLDGASAPVEEALTDLLARLRE